MLKHWILVGGAFLFLAVTYLLSETVVAAQQSSNTAPTTTPKPQYDPTADTIVTGLKGVATGTQAALNSYSDNLRTTIIHDAFLAAIPTIGSKGGYKFSLSEVAILCNVREAYAQAKAHADHINAITGALDMVATPAQIGSLGDAITSLLKKYSIDVKNNGSPAQPGATSAACIKDLGAWADYYYNKKPDSSLRIASVTTSGGIDSVFAGLGDVSGLVGAVINIITPVMVYVATVENQKQRQAVIDNYLADPMYVSGSPNQSYAWVPFSDGDDAPKTAPNTNIENLVAEAEKLVTAANDVAVQARHQALGQFMEKLEALREVQVHIDDLKANLQTGAVSCKDALGSYTGASVPISVKTAAATPARTKTLYFKAVPAWIYIGINVYDGVDLLGNEMNPNPIPANTTVSSMDRPLITMSTKTKSAISKGVAVRFTSPDGKTTAEYSASDAIKSGSNQLNFNAVAPWPTWITAKAKITSSATDAIPNNTTVTAVTFTSVDMSQAATGAIDAMGGVEFTIPTASEGYISCVAQLEKQIATATSDLIKAADNYDTAAQAQSNSDDLVTKVAAIGAATKTKQPWPASKSPYEQDAADLAAFGAAMEKAFSSSNITALEKALNAFK